MFGSSYVTKIFELTWKCAVYWLCW